MNKKSSIYLIQLVNLFKLKFYNNKHKNYEANLIDITYCLSNYDWLQ